MPERPARLRIGALLLAGLAGMPAPLTAQEITGFGEELEKRAVKLVLILAPEYPKEALARGIGATIDVTGKVKADGTLDFPIVHATPDQVPFQKAVLEAVPYWLFQPPADGTTCEPREVDGMVRVWFEAVDGKPKVSVSQLKGPTDAVAASEPLAPVVKQKDGNSRIRYPDEALRRRVEGSVTALAVIERSGEVARVTLRPGSRNSWFGSTVTKTLSEWRFDILPGFPEQGRICTEFRISFKIH